MELFFRIPFSKKEKSILKIIKKLKFLNPIKLINNCFSKIYIKREMKKNTLRNFSSFKKTYIRYSEPLCDYSALMKYKHFDLYVVGSDQMWNFESRKEFAQITLLSFAPETAKKMAFAVSFGKKEIEPSMEKYVSEQLKKFNFISVREKSGVKICDKLGYKNAFVHHDPTMQLSVNDYRELYDESTVVPKDKYVLLYLLNNPCDFSLQSFFKWAKKEKLKVVYINGNSFLPKFNLYKKTYATIPQWLKLIDCAEYVFTNSFHGTVFSILFNKSFMAIQQSKDYAAQNERLNSLLFDFNLEKSFFQGDFNEIKKTLNYETLNKILYKNREKSCIEEYLRTI